MASTYTPLGVELMVTGENAGTWGTKTNTNLNIIEQISGGYLELSIAGGAGTQAVDKTDGGTGSAVATRVIKFTGSITGNITVTTTGQVATISLNGDKLILKYYGKLDPKISSGYTIKTPKNTTGYVTKTPA